MAMRLLRRSTYALRVRQFYPLVLTPQTMHTSSHMCSEGKISLQVFDDQLFKACSLDLKLYRANLVFFGSGTSMILGDGAYKINEPIPRECVLSRHSKLPEVMKFVYARQGVDGHGYPVSIIAYDILGTPLERFFTEFKNCSIDSRALNIIRMLLYLSFSLHEEGIIGALDKRNIFLVDQMKHIRIAVVHGLGNIHRRNDQEEIATWLREVYGNYSGHDEFNDFCEKLSNNHFTERKSYYEHPFFWTLEMKKCFIRNLHCRLSKTLYKDAFDEVICLQTPWNLHMDHLLFNYMSVHQLEENGTKSYRVYDIDRPSDLIALIINLFEHAEDYPICTKVCGRTFEEQEAYIRFCFPRLFCRLIQRVKQLRWEDLIPSF